MKALLIGLMALTSLASLAGTPDQDPVVRKMMDRFSKAGRPSADRLLKNTYKCFDYAAGRDRYNKGEEFRILDFTNTNGFVTSHGFPSATYFYNENQAEFTALYEFVHIPLFIAVREESDGTLIIEEGAKAKTGTYYRQYGLTGLEVQALSDNIGYAFQYDVCTKQ